MDYRYEAPPILRDYLIYHETIKGHSRTTVDEYFLDLRNFFRFLKIGRGLVPRATELSEISILDVDLDFVSRYVYKRQIIRRSASSPALVSAMTAI